MRLVKDIPYGKITPLTDLIHVKINNLKAKKDQE